MRDATGSVPDVGSAVVWAAVINLGVESLCQRYSVDVR
jgi:hypothetical protein